MNFKEAMDWLNDFQQFGMNLGLERIKALLKKLDNPERSLKIIHIAGTNGKGSVCRYLSSILIEAGYNIGMTTSPHLETILERFVINNKLISKKDFISIASYVKENVEKLNKEGIKPTYFEVCTAIAFLYFNIKKVDYAIIEVGLGGRFDATNVVSPIVTVITNISYDHQHILGKSVKKITFEKAGIIKKNIPIVTGAEGQSLDIIKNIAENLNSPFYQVKNDATKVLSKNLSGQYIEINGELNKYNLEISDIASYQVKNLSVAIKTIEVLQINGLFISEEAIQNGVKSTFHPGRMNIIQNNPIVIIDGAHNPAGIFELKQTIKNYFKGKRIIFIFGVLIDKKIKEMIKKIQTIPDTIILTKSSNERAADPIDIKKMISHNTIIKKIIISNSIKEAIEKAFKLANSNEIIIISGSLYTVQESIEYFKKKY